MTAITLTKSNGWNELLLANDSREAYQSLIRLTNSLKLELDQIDKNTLSIDNKLLKLETLKSSVRSIIRYSSEARLFASKLTAEFIKIDNRLANYYLTPPYLMFHLPNDQSEVSPIHGDQIKECQNMFTSWTALNDRQIKHAALSLFNFSHTNVRNLMDKVYQKLNGSYFFPRNLLLKKLGCTQHDLVPQQNYSYVWNSKLLHKGNLNLDSKPHCALVFRLSQFPLYYEPTVKCLEIANEKHFANKTESLMNVVDALIPFINLGLTAPLLNIFNDEAVKWINDVEKKINNLPLNLRKHLSFSFSLIAQRLQVISDVNSFNLISFLLGKENLVSLEKFLNSCSDKNSLDLYIKFFNKRLPMKSYQELILLKKIKSKSIFKLNVQSNLSQINKQSNLSQINKWIG
tara:strand:+ start:9347 stop:10555 length:1209 start_codon:yes stop_codon:yes gene_type:complete